MTAAAGHRTHWPAVLAAFAAGVAVALNIGKVPVALPVLRQELGLSLLQAGWVSSMLTTLAAGLALAMGMWVGRLGALRLVMAGLLLTALASVSAAGMAQGFVGLLLTRFAEGLGFMMVVVSAPALVTAAAAGPDRRFALSIWSAFMPAGAALGLAAGPWLIPTAGWRSLWLAVSLGLLLAAWAVFSLRRHYPGTQPAGRPASFLAPVRQALGQPLPWLLAPCFGLWAVQHFALIVWMPSYLIEHRGLGAVTAALWTATMVVANVPGNLLGGWLSQRGLPRGWQLSLGHLATGLGALAYTTDALPDALRLAAAVGVSFVGGLIPSAVLSSSTVLARDPQQTGTLQGLYIQTSQLGQFIGTPLIAATVAAAGSWTAGASAVVLPAAALGLLLGLAAWLAERRPPS
ncbi:MAG: MFS transporter [Rubrivivax sp.]|nr:MFS transporter [Rubrivivax sp.]